MAVKKISVKVQGVNLGNTNLMAPPFPNAPGQPNPVSTAQTFNISLMPIDNLQGNGMTINLITDDLTDIIVGNEYSLTLVPKVG